MTVTQADILPGLGALFPESPYTAFQLTDDVIDTFHIGAGGFQLPFRFRLLGPVHHYSRSLFKDLSSAVSFSAQYVRYLSLPYYGVSVDTYPCIHYQIPYVPKPALVSVDTILTLTCPEHTPRQSHFLIIYRQAAVFVVDDQRDLSHSPGFPAVSSREDDFFHLPASQRLGALLSQHPPYSVAYIALTAAVRPHDTGQSPVELYSHRFCKGLEPMHLYPLKIHLYYISFSSMALAARCSACFLLLPVPLATAFPLTSSCTWNVLS